MGTLKFQLRGTQLAAWYSLAGASGVMYSGVNNDPDAPAVQTNAATGIFGGKVINTNPSSTGYTVKALVFRGFENTPNARARSVLIRIVPSATGIIATQALFSTGYGPSSQIAGDFAWFDALGRVNFYSMAPQGATAATATSSALSFTENVPSDILITWDGTLADSSVKIYQDGTLVGSNSGNFINYTVNQGLALGIALGSSPYAFAPTSFTFNEFCIFEGVQDFTFPRSDFFDAPNFDGALSTDPGEANVRNGDTYKLFGVEKTGTLKGAVLVTGG